MAQEITVEDLFRKIGYLVIQLDAANARIELLAKEIEENRSNKAKRENIKTSENE